MQAKIFQWGFLHLLQLLLELIEQGIVSNHQFSSSIAPLAFLFLFYHHSFLIAVYSSFPIITAMTIEMADSTIEAEYLMLVVKLV